MHAHTFRIYKSPHHLHYLLVVVPPSCALPALLFACPLQLPSPRSPFLHNHAFSKHTVAGPVHSSSSCFPFLHACLTCLPFSDNLKLASSGRFPPLPPRSPFSHICPLTLKCSPPPCLPFSDNVKLASPSNSNTVARPCLSLFTVLAFILACPVCVSSPA